MIQVTPVRQQVSAATSQYPVTTFGAPVGIGNFVAVCVALQSRTVTVNTVTDGTNTYYQAKRQLGAGTDAIASEIWFAYNVLGTPTAITVNLSASIANQINISEWKGVLKASTPLDQTNGNAASSLANPYDFNFGSITPTQPGELIIASHVDTTTFTVDGTSGGMTALTNGTRRYSQYIVQSGAAAQNGAISFSTTEILAGAIASFKQDTPTPATQALALAGTQPSVAAVAPAIIIPSCGGLIKVGAALAMAVGLAIVPATAGVIFAGTQPSVTWQAEIAPAGGDLVVAGTQPGVTQQILVTPSVGALVAAGSQPAVPSILQVAPSAGSLVVAGSQPSALRAFDSRPSAGALIAAGSQPAVSFGLDARPSAGVLVATGSQPAVLLSRDIRPSVGALVAAGQAAQPAHALQVAPAVGLVSASGVVPIITLGLDVRPTMASVAFIGQTAVQSYMRTITPSAGAIIAAGSQPTVPLGRDIRPAIGSVVAMGQVAQSFHALTVTPTRGALAAAGTAPTVLLSLDIRPLAGALVAAGSQPGVTQQILVTPNVGMLVAAGVQPAILRAFDIRPSSASLAATGTMVSIALSGATSITPSAGVVVAAGQFAAPSHALQVTPSARALVAAGSQPIVSCGLNVSPAAALVAVAGPQPSVTRQIVIAPSVGTVVAGGPQPDVIFQQSITPGAGAVVVVGTQPAVTRQTIITPNVGMLVAAGVQPAILRAFDIRPSAGLLAAIGTTVSVTGSGSTIPLDIRPSAGALAVVEQGAVQSCALTITVGAYRSSEDSFTDADGIDLVVHNQEWTVPVGAWNINGNTICPTVQGTVNIARHVSRSDASQIRCVPFVTWGGGAITSAGEPKLVCVRMNGTDLGYAFGANVNTGKWAFFKHGENLQDTNYSFNNAISNVIRIQAVGSGPVTLHAWVNEERVDDVGDVVDKNDFIVSGSPGFSTQSGALLHYDALDDWSDEGAFVGLSLDGLQPAVSMGHIIAPAIGAVGLNGQAAHHAHAIGITPAARALVFVGLKAHRMRLTRALPHSVSMRLVTLAAPVLQSVTLAAPVLQSVTLAAPVLQSVTLAAPVLQSVTMTG